MKRERKHTSKRTGNTCLVHEWETRDVDTSVERIVSVSILSKKENKVSGTVKS